MRDFADHRKDCVDLPIFSGCAFIYPAAAFADSGGFWRGFFLYFEDFDLSLCAHRIANRMSDAFIVCHEGGHTSRKRWPHLLAFGVSMLQFYYRHGIRWR